MQVIKPQRIALLYKTFEHLGRCRLAVTAALYFPVRQPAYLLPEIAMWKRVAQDVDSQTPFDLCMPKSCAEVLVSGQCFAPGGTAVARASVGLRITDTDKALLDKQLIVFGDRFWQRGPGGMKASAPIPFLSIPIDYAHAFGGRDYAQNPAGKGASALAPGADKQIRHPLPNVEDPARPVLSPEDRLPPAGFAALDFTWPQRASKAGTYDVKWLKERFPAYADDMDMSIFNAAPPDQWLKGFFKGDETFAVTGMHPESAVVSGQLPGVATRCLVDQQTGAGLCSREVPMRAETLWLFPHAERAILICRGDIDIASDDGEDIVNLLIAAEPMAEPRSVDYYRQVLAARLDPRQGAQLALRDDQLLPPLPARAVAFPDDGGVDDWIYTPMGHQGRRLRTRMTNELEQTKLRMLEVRKRIVASQQTLAEMARRPEFAPKHDEIVSAVAAIEAQLLQVDAMMGALQMPPEEPPASLEELPALKKKLLEQGKRMQDAAKLKQAESEQKIRAALAGAEQSVAGARTKAEALAAEAINGGDAKTIETAKARLAELPAKGLDYDKLTAAARQQAGGPPKPMAARTVATIADAQRRAEAAVTQASQSIQKAGLAPGTTPTAAALPPPLDLPKLEGQLRELDRRIATTYRQNAHMMMPAMPIGRDDSKAARERVLGAHAGKLSLAAVDLTGADLSGLDLGGIDFSDALLEGCDFSGTRLSGAKLSGAVLARARMCRASLVGADLVGANLGFADFSDADATQADMSGATLANAILNRANFSDVRLDKADLLGIRLSATNLSRVTAAEAKFINVNLTAPDEPPAVDFEPQPEPDLDMRGVILVGAMLEKACFINCVLEDADFSGARLAGAIFLAAKGDRAVFRGADMTNVRMVSACSFRDSDFSGARLDKALLRGCRLDRSNFSGCSALLADFSQATLSRCKFAKVLARGARFAKADLTLAEMQGINLSDGVLQKATLHGTRLQDSNLFGADLLRIKVDDGTDFSRANRGRTLAGAVDRK